MLHFNLATPDDIDAVVSGLWDRGAREASNYGFKTKDQIREYLKGMCDSHAYVLAIDNARIAAFGACAVRRNVYSTWFIATDRFSEAGAPITRFLRGFIREKLFEHPGAQIEMSSAVDHPDAERWFKILGFERVPDKEHGVFLQYIYKAS